MNIIIELEKQYFEIDDKYSSKEFEARRKNFSGAEQKWKRKRELNTQAYFLFIFTRLEDQIREQSSQLVSDKQSKLRNWKKRAAWDILNKDKESDKIYFMNRVALLTNKNHHHYGKVKGYYEQRNIIAHGGIVPLAMVNVFAEMKELYRILKK